MSTNSTQTFTVEQGDSIKNIALNFGVLPTLSIRAKAGSSGTIKVCGTMLDLDIDYSQDPSYDNPYITPTLIDYNDTTATPIVGGVLTIVEDTYTVYKLDVDMLLNVGFSFTSIDGDVEITLTVEDSQYA